MKSVAAGECELSSNSMLMLITPLHFSNPKAVVQDVVNWVLDARIVADCVIAIKSVLATIAHKPSTNFIIIFFHYFLF
jgi:hypothetical protein